MDPSKAAQAFADELLVVAVEKDPMRVVILTENLPSYMGLMTIALTLTQQEVANWKLRMLDRRQDAWILRSIAFVVNNAVKEGRTLPDTDLFQGLFERIGLRCNSASRHVTAPNWIAAARPPTPHAADPAVSSPDLNSVDVSAQSPPPARGSEDNTPTAATNTYALKDSTIALLERAASELDMDRLLTTLNETAEFFPFQDLDRALQISLDRAARSISRGQSEEIQQYVGSTILTGYIVSREMLGTRRSILRYSNSHTEAANASRIGQILQDSDSAEILTHAGPASVLFVGLQIEMAGRISPLAELPSESQEALVGGAATVGLLLGIAEHDTFAV